MQCYGEKGDGPESMLMQQVVPQMVGSSLDLSSGMLGRWHAGNNVGVKVGDSDEMWYLVFHSANVDCDSDEAWISFLT